MNDKESFTLQKIPSYLFWAILATGFFIPFGIIAIVYASKVKAFLINGDVSNAINASKRAKRWCWFAVAAGLVILLITVLAQL